MLPWWTWLAILGAPAFIAGIIVWAVKAERKRRAQLTGDAAMRGWTYQRKVAWHDGLTGHPFGTGHSRRSHDGIEGSHGTRSFQAFTYQFNTSGDKGQQQVHSFTVLLYPMASKHDGVAIQRRHLGHRILALFGKGPKRTGNDAFDKKWVAKRTDKGDPMRIDHSIQQVVMLSPKLRWQWSGDTLRVVSGGALTVKRLEWMLAQAQRFRDAAGDDSW